MSVLAGYATIGSLSRQSGLAYHTLLARAHRRKVPMEKLGRQFLIRRGDVSLILRELRQTRKPYSKTLYSRWRAMLQRCYDPSHVGFGDYGGRGITVCREWRRSFLSFARDMGEPPPDQVLDRENNNGNYNKKNCRWVTRTVSNLNQRRRVGGTNAN